MEEVVCGIAPLVFHLEYSNIPIEKRYIFEAVIAVEKKRKAEKTLPYVRTMAGQSLCEQARGPCLV